MYDLRNFSQGIYLYENLALCPFHPVEHKSDIRLIEVKTNPKAKGQKHEK